MARRARFTAARRSAAVVALRSQRGTGTGQVAVAVEAGSFGTVQGAVSARGGDARNAYAFSAAGGHTDNERANNAFDSANYTLRLDHRVGDTLAIGGTLRGFHGRYGSPGDRFTNDPDNTEREANLLATVFADLAHGPGLTSHITLGGQDRRFESENPRVGRPTAVTIVKNRRAVLDWQSTCTASAQHRITGGFTGEINHTVNTGFGAIDRHQRLFAVFAQDEWTPVENFHLTAGLRNDDFDTFGRTTTGRVTAAWLTGGAHLKLRLELRHGFSRAEFPRPVRAERVLRRQPQPQGRVGARLGCRRRLLSREQSRHAQRDVVPDGFARSHRLQLRGVSRHGDQHRARPHPRPGAGRQVHAAGAPSKRARPTPI